MHKALHAAVVTALPLGRQGPRSSAPQAWQICRQPAGVKTPPAQLMYSKHQALRHALSWRQHLFSVWAQGASRQLSSQILFTSVSGHTGQADDVVS